MVQKKPLRIAHIGRGFMGRAHSNAWSQVAKFFPDAPLVPLLHTLAATSAEGLDDFARRWGWLHCTASWRKAVAAPDVDLVDVSTPNHLHAPMALAALAAGKHVACEKPLAGTLADARRMAAAARKAAKAKLKTFVWFNYRRVPAVALAHRLVKEGRIGTIRRVRASYLQDWADESVPLTWRFQRRLAGSGAHGDLNAHIVDMVRFVTGQEVAEIAGALAETFIKTRSLPARGSHKGKVNVDDTVLFLARLSGGAAASFEAARQATGNQNRNGFEINGTKGALRFDFERMNELAYYDATLPRAVQGWTTILCTHGGDHPYAEAWWPDAHLIGYEHGFVNMAADILAVLAGRRPVVPLPDFGDAYQTQRVLEAALVAARTRRWVKLSRVR